MALVGIVMTFVGFLLAALSVGISSSTTGRLGLVLNFVRGIAVYVSGKIAKLAPDSIRLETPGAIVGVRGTTVAVQVVPR